MLGVSYVPIEQLCQPISAICPRARGGTEHQRPTQVFSPLIHVRYSLPLPPGGHRGLPLAPIPASTGQWADGNVAENDMIKEGAGFHARCVLASRPGQVLKLLMEV